jgi:hypothetical protein
MAKKPLTTVTIKTNKVGPRKIVEMTGVALPKLKFERELTIVWSVGQEDGQKLWGRRSLAPSLLGLEDGVYDKVAQLSLNDDYHTFTVMVLERIII